MLITKELLKSFEPCKDRWGNYLEHYSDWSGTPLEFVKIDKISTKDKIWTLLRKEFISENDLHELACKFAESVLHIFEEKYPSDNRPRKAIEARRKWLAGEITDAELSDARTAAGFAAYTVANAAARAAARATAYAACVAADATGNSYTAFDVAYAAGNSYTVAGAIEREKQLQLIIDVLKKDYVQC